VKGHWTRAKVRHKTPKWYWVRWDEDDDPSPAQMHATEPNDNRNMYANNMWRNFETSGAERWSSPIPQPPGGEG